MDNEIPAAGLPAPLSAPLADPRRSGLRTALIAGAAVLAVAAGASAYSLGNFLSGGGTQPDDVLRSGAIAFAKVDLDPAANQKLAIYQLSKKFPALVKDAGGEGAVRDTLLKQIFEDGKTSYEKDIKPWLGDRAAVAVYPPAGKSKTPRYAVAVQYTDEAEMTASMKKDAADDKKLDWTTRDGYVVVTEDAEAEDMVAPNGAEALAAQPNFSHDVDALDGDQVAVAWADLGAVADIATTYATAEISKSMGSTKSGMSTGGMNTEGLPPEFAAQMEKQMAEMQKQTTEQLAKLADVSGRVAMGVHAAGDFLEVQGKMFGVKGADAVSAQPGTDLAGQMPADSLAVFSASGVSKGLDAYWKNVGAMSPMAAPMIEGMLSQYGLKLPADFGALFGDETAVSLGAASKTDPKLVIRTRGGDMARAQQLATMLTSALGMDPAASEKLADGFVLGNDAKLVKETASGGAKLADSPAYGKAVPDADHASLVAYADLARMMSVFDAPADDVKKFGNVKAVGFTMTAATEPTWRLRITTK